MCNANIPQPVLDRYWRVKAGFVSRGTTLHAWCLAEGLTRQNVTKALLEEWSGPKASQLVDRVLQAAGVDE